MDRSPDTSSKKRGGGVIIAIRKKFISSQLICINHNIEQVFVKIHLGSLCYIFGSVYFPPSSNEYLYQCYCCELDNLVRTNPNAKFCICGDFNIPDFVLADTGLSYAFLNDKVDIIFDLMKFFGLTQINNVKNSYGRLLDLIMVSHDICENFFDLQSSLEPIVPVDAYHPPIVFGLLYSNLKFLKDCPNYIYDFNCIDYDAMRGGFYEHQLGCIIPLKFR